MFPEEVRQNASDPEQIKSTWPGQGVTTFRKFLGQSAHFWQMGAGTSSAEPEFLCVVIHTTFRELRNGRWSLNLASKCSSVSRRWIREDIFENFHFRGHLPTKSKIESLSNRHLSEQAAGHGMHCREILFTPRCSPRARQFPIPGQLFYTTYGCGATGNQIAQFPDFDLFFPNKTPETYLPVTSQNDYHFPRGRWRSKEVHSGCVVSCNFC